MNGTLVGCYFPLPDEVMRSIFLAFLERDEVGCSDPFSISSPIRLSWVCRYWRDLCLSSPELWSGVNLNIQNFSSQSSDLNLLDLWIERSNPFPLSVKLTCANNDPKQTPMLILPQNDSYLQAMAALTNRLLACRGRWRALNLAVLDVSFIDPLLRALSQPLSTPCLEHITISTQYLGIFGEIRTYSFASAVQLRTLNLLSPLIVPEGPAILENLAELDLRYCSSIHGCLSWLHRAPNLEILKVRFFTAEAQQLASDRICRLPRLRQLEVAAYSTDSDPGPFLDLLDLPALDDLYVDINELIAAPNWQYVLDLIIRSRPPIRSLVLLGTPMTDATLRECISRCPLITYLGLGTVSEETLQAMTIQNTSDSDSQPSAPLCPAIEVLDIAYDDECPLESLTKMVHSRLHDRRSRLPSKPYKTLEALGIPHGSDSPVILHPLIQDCMERGLEVIERPLDSE